jgi:hypothetical protein
MEITTVTLVGYLAALEASVGTVWAAVVADRKNKIPNAAVAATSGIALIFVLAAMMLRTASGAPTVTLAHALPWFFLALCSTYNFLVWMGQPGSRSTLGIVSGMTGAFAALFEEGSLIPNISGPLFYAPFFLASISLGTFLGGGVALHWYLKVPNVHPVMARRLVILGLASALISAGLQVLAVVTAQDLLPSTTLGLTGSTILEWAIPISVASWALWAISRQELRKARLLLYLASLICGISLIANKWLILLTGKVF